MASARSSFMVQPALLWERRKSRCLDSQVDAIAPSGAPTKACRSLQRQHGETKGVGTVEFYGATRAAPVGATEVAMLGFGVRRNRAFRRSHKIFRRGD